LERLEAIVEELEAGSLTLEESIARYEEGMKLSRRLTQTLDEAEKRIERLVESEGGLGTEPMELESEAANQPTPAAREGPSRARRPTPAEIAAPTRSDPDELPF
jgi:exodeoxyribonuclease VII small subunit